MAPFDNRAQKKGRAAMEGSLTAAARVRRRMKAGRPTPLSGVDALKALSRLTVEADKAKQLMRDEGLHPEDILCALVFIEGTQLGIKRLPPPGKLAPFFDYFDKHICHFLGIMWQQRDREAGTDEAPYSVWLTPLTTRPEDHELLLLARNYVTQFNSKPLQKAS